MAESERGRSRAWGSVPVSKVYYGPVNRRPPLGAYTRGGTLVSSNSDTSAYAIATAQPLHKTCYCAAGLSLKPLDVSGDDEFRSTSDVLGQIKA
jgi:hypothetical protein